MFTVPHSTGAQLNLQDVYGRTELMLASSSGQADIVRLLLKAGQYKIQYKHVHLISHTFIIAIKIAKAMYQRKF